MNKFLFWFILFTPLLAVSQSDFDKAEKLFREGNFKQSQLLFENIVKDNPSNTKSIEYLGDIQGNYRSWDRAMFYYEKLKKLKPSEANYYYKYGGALGMKASESNKFKALGMIGEVKYSFEKAIQLNPKHIEARWALIELYLQLPRIVGGSEKKALYYANQLAELSPVDGYLSKAHIAEYFKRFSEAEKQYKKAAEHGGSKKSHKTLENLNKFKMNQPNKAQSISNS